MEIPDLSKIGQSTDDQNGEPPTIRARTAFLIVVDENGDVSATPDINLPVERAQMPSADDMYGACAVIQRDIALQLTAQQTVLGMQQMAMAQAQRLQENQLLQGLNLKGR